MSKIISTALFGLVAIVLVQMTIGQKPIEDSLSVQSVVEFVKESPQQASTFVDRVTDKVGDISQKSAELEASVSQLAEGGEQIKSSLTKMNEALSEFRDGKDTIVTEFENLEGILKSE